MRYFDGVSKREGLSLMAMLASALLIAFLSSSLELSSLLSFFDDKRLW
jgi:hypothetical protein